MRDITLQELYAAALAATEHYNGRLLTEREKKQVMAACLTYQREQQLWPNGTPKQ